MRTPRGFTLVEVMVSIVIVTVLTASAWSLSRRAIQAAQLAESTSNLRQLASANAGYIADHRRYAPATDERNLTRWHGGRSSRKGHFDPTAGFLSPYLGGSRQIGFCPRLLDMIDDPESWESGSGGYGYNATYLGGTPENPYRPNVPANVRNAATTLMFATTALAKSEGLQEYPFAEPRQWVDPNGKLAGRLQPSVHFRFSGKALIAWCDGSVSATIMTEGSQLNYYGGSNEESGIGFPGPDQENGWWNPAR
jgi:prepilin-type N-terminal cleavage/methylation domain-containing protein